MRITHNFGPKTLLMKKLLGLIIVFAAFSLDAFSQQKSQQFTQITTIESVVGGGAGRSKLIITNPDGSQEERDLENLFSLTGINFKNIKQNENDILTVLKTYTEKGWKLVSTVPLTLSPNQGGSGIFMTRYLFVKE
jgi:hypothetical protein